jgi:hypothetical protein
MIQITNFNNLADWFYIVPAVFLVDFIVVCLAKYPGINPYFKINTLDKWYTMFGIFAIGSDVLSILIGIMMTRYIYTSFSLTNPMYFIAILLLFQLFHDIFFYVFVIQPIPRGHNKMIDIFKDYGLENGAKILVADALMMIFSVLIASLLKYLPNHYTIATLFVTLYSFCYIIFTRTPVV